MAFFNLPDTCSTVCSCSRTVCSYLRIQPCQHVAGFMMQIAITVCTHVCKFPLMFAYWQNFLKWIWFGSWTRCSLISDFILPLELALRNINANITEIFDLKLEIVLAQIMNADSRVWMGAKINPKRPSLNMYVPVTQNICDVIPLYFWMKSCCNKCWNIPSASWLMFLHWINGL